MSVAEETAVLSAVSAFLGQLVSRDPARSDGARTIVVAFSGGPDSTAMLWALVRGTRRLRDAGPTRLVAAHLDHGLDAGSAERADQATGIARLLGLGACLRVERVSPSQSAPFQDGIEDWARRKRYEFLHRVALEENARVVVTAHHADDQAETVALRLLYGSGLRGLAGAWPARDLDDGVRLVRPLLGVRRRHLEAALDTARREIPALVPIQDPTNDDLRQPRALLRRHLLPALESQSPGATRAMIRTAEAAWKFHRRLDNRLDGLLAPPVLADEETHFDFFLPPRRAISLAAFLDLPSDLQRQALARLHARIGQSHPPAESAVCELMRQLDVYLSFDNYLSCGDDADGNRDARRRGVGVDCGDGMRWSVLRNTPPALILERRISPKPFTYTFDTPGTAHVPEIFLSLHCRPHEPNEPQPWMFRGEVLRTGLSLPAGWRPVATVRCRRPGDRLQPLGSNGSRKLKDLLIDRKVPRAVRNRLPLLFLDGILAWVPGVTVDERFRLGAPDMRHEAQRIWMTQIRRWPRAQ